MYQLSSADDALAARAPKPDTLDRPIKGKAQKVPDRFRLA